MKKKFFLRLILFVLLFFLINHQVMRSYIRFARQKFVYEHTRRTFEGMMDQVSLLVAGDSHVLDSFDDTNVPDAYNFATKGESPILSYYKLRHYIVDEGFRPQVVVLPVDLNTFSSYRTEGIRTQDPAFWSQYVNYFELGREEGALGDVMLNRIKAEFAYLGGLDEVLDVMYPSEPWEVAEMQLGYLPIYGDYSALNPARQLRLASMRSTRDFDGHQYFDPVVVKYQERLLALLDEYGIEVVFVWYPVTELYSQQAEQFVPVGEHFVTVQSMFGGQADALWLDYHDLFFDHPELFSDATHLNYEGAQAFTEQFLQDLAVNGVSW